MVLNKKYLSDLMKGKEYGSNTLILAPCGSGKTYYIMNELCNDKKCLYLCDNSNLEHQVLLEKNTHKLNMVRNFINRTDITVMTYAKFGSIIRHDKDGKYIQQFEIVIADEVHNLVNYKEFNDSANLHYALLSLCRKYKNTKVFWFTGTPYSLNKLAKESDDIDEHFITYDFLNSKEIMKYFNKRMEYISHITQIEYQLSRYQEGFEFGMKCLIYTQKISAMEYIKEVCEKLNLKPISIWSINNSINHMSDEQMKVRNYLLENGELMSPYNVLIINRAMETGVNIYDKDMQLAIINTNDLTQQTQARGRIRHDIDLLVLRNKDMRKSDGSVKIKEEYLDKWLLIEEIEQIILENLLRNDRGKLYSIGKFKEKLENDTIYQLETKRKTIEGKKITHYKITKKGQ